MMVTGHRIDAEEAFAIGLVNRVVPRDELLSTAASMARQIALFAPVAVRKAKQAVARGSDLSLPEGLKLEKRLATSLL